ncbi:MAG TPA: CDP-alcohol phosphatidyltransferase family protein [Candidatus Nanopelagicaceae bacterium]|nr:CDP-alcohol phosphatidyltransferase family protein [Candidatus Nanopelagicaceae bacterium]
MLEDTTGHAKSRILTIPNLLSVLRLIGVPFFYWFLLQRRDGIAIALLSFAGISDYLDGKIARRFNQYSRLGELLDPLADRFYILATLIGLSVRSIIPWWLASALIGRDLLLALTLPILKRRGYGPLPVSFLGKTATFSLLYAFPILLLGQGEAVVARIAHPIGWAFAIWGAGLYLITGVHYARQVASLVKAQTSEF